MEGAQASCTDIESPFLTSYNHCGLVDIGHPASVGAPLGMAYIVTELKCFTTELTLAHRYPP